VRGVEKSMIRGHLVASPQKRNEQYKVSGYTFLGVENAGKLLAGRNAALPDPAGGQGAEADCS